MSISEIPVGDPFAFRFGLLLRSVRRERRMRIRHLADHAMPARSLRAAEAGTLVLAPVTVTELALRYGVELGEVLEHRSSVTMVEDGMLRFGNTIVGFVAGDEWSLLQGYLDAVRAARALAEDDLVALRRSDMDALAHYLDVPARAVIDHLGVLMGASEAESRAMVSLYLAHASVIGCTSAN